MASSDSSKPTSKATRPTQQSQYDAPLSANFSSTASSATVDYDHEIYLQLVSGSDSGSGGSSTSSAAVAAGTATDTGKKKNKAPKTANQVYREERTRHMTTRALDPAILEPRGDPSSVDFECAEIQRKKDRFQ